MKRQLLKTKQKTSKKTKTEKQKAMKTKNNVQKTILRSIAVVVSFVLISITVSAQGFWKKLLENSSFNEIALAMVETSNKEANTEPAAGDFYYSILENETEPNLELEDWMSRKGYDSIDAFKGKLSSNAVNDPFV